MASQLRKERSSDVMADSLGFRLREQVGTSGGLVRDQSPELRWVPVGRAGRVASERGGPPQDGTLAVRALAEGAVAAERRGPALQVGETVATATRLGVVGRADAVVGDRHLH